MASLNDIHVPRIPLLLDTCTQDSSRSGPFACHKLATRTVYEESVLTRIIRRTPNRSRDKTFLFVKLARMSWSNCNADNSACPKIDANGKSKRDVEGPADALLDTYEKRVLRRAIREPFSIRSPIF